MASMIYNICVDCADPWSLGQFWSDVLGRPVDPESAPGDEEVGIELPDSDGGSLIFARVPEGKVVKNRVHVCVRPLGERREVEVERLLARGATMVDDRRRANGRGWAVMADPEGNEFCVLGSPEDRAAAHA
jgi:predicted enzyme related to lactoylglutathione lyase